ncbi:MAG: glycosyltransferase, partial [Acidobacteriota bacterium]
MLLTHERFLPDFAGGGEYLVAGTAKHLLSAGVAVRVLTTGDPKLLAYEGVPTVRLPAHRYRFNLAVRRIEELARDADLIQTFNYHACLPSFLAARRLGKPIVCLALAVFGRTWLEMKGQLVGRAAALWERYVLTRPYDRLIFLSEHNRQLGMDFGVAAARSVVIDPAVDVHEYGPAPEKEDVVLFSAKLEARKGVPELLDVARALPDVRFQVLG